MRLLHYMVKSLTVTKILELAKQTIWVGLNRLLNKPLKIA